MERNLPNEYYKYHIAYLKASTIQEYIFWVLMNWLDNNFCNITYKTKVLELQLNAWAFTTDSYCSKKIPETKTIV